MPIRDDTRTAGPLAWPPLLASHACLLAAIAGLLAWRFPLQGLTALFAIALLILAHFTRGMVHRMLLYCVFFAAGFAFGGMTEQIPPETIPAWVMDATEPVGKNTSPPSFANGVAITGTIRENSRLEGNRSRLLLENVTAKDHPEPLPGYLVLTWQYPDPELERAGPGMTLSATVRLRRIHGFANPGTWDTETYWRDRGAYFRAWSRGDGTRRGAATPVTLDGQASFFWKTRENLRDKTLAALLSEVNTEKPALSQPAAVIMALLFGDRSFCSREMLDLVAKATLAHSLALSGMHLGFAAALGYGTAWLAGFFFPNLFLRIPRQKVGILLALPVAAAYLWIGGAPPSLMRAALMLFFWALLLWRGKPKVLMDGLIWAVATIIVLSPASLYDIRLQLSAVSVAGIGLAVPFLRKLTASLQGKLRILSPILSTAGISLAAQAAVLPLTLDAFPGTGVWFPLNLLWLPVLGVWVMPAAFAGLLCAASGFAGPAAAFFSIAEIPCAALFTLLHGMDTAGILAAPVSLRPAWPAMAGYWLVILLVPRIFMGISPRKNAALLFVALGLVAGPAVGDFAASRKDRVTLTVIDVGQGQSILVAWQGIDTGRALIDGGGFASSSFDLGRQVVTPVLTANTPPDLAWIINSHPDADHLQGLLFPLATFKVGQVAFGPGEPQKSQTVTKRDTILRQRGIKPQIVHAGDVISLSRKLSFEVLHPDGFPEKASNNNALVLRLVWDGKPLALICGDVEKPGIRDLLKRADPLTADVLILPHHGSATSLSTQLYDAVKPKLAVAACGYANTWYFPAESVKQALAARNIPLETTAASGQITITWEEGTMKRDYARSKQVFGAGHD